MKTTETKGGSKAARLVRTALLHVAVSGVAVGVIVAGALALGHMGYMSAQLVALAEKGSLLLIPYYLAVGSKVHADYIREVSEGGSPASGGECTGSLGMAAATARLVRTAVTQAVVSGMVMGALVAGALVLGRVGWMPVPAVKGVEGFGVGWFPYWMAVVSRLHAEHIRQQSRQPL